MVVIDRAGKRWILVDFPVPFDANIAKKEEEKVKVGREHKVNVEIVPIVVGALGVVTKDLEGYLDTLGVGGIIGGLQTAALIGTAAILMKVLSN